MRRALVCLVALLALLAVATQAEPLKTHVLFSGGGIRAQFGAMIAMCEIYDSIAMQQPADRAVQIEQFVGLSGGAWGSLMLSNMKRAWGSSDPCAEVTRVTGLKTWGHMTEFHPVRCGSSGERSCYGGWKQGVVDMYHTARLKSTGSAFGPDTRHTAIFANCLWNDKQSRHIGICASEVDSNRVRCQNFNQALDADAKYFEFPYITASVLQHNSEKTRTKMFSARFDEYDLLSLSSAAFAEATAVSGAAKFVKGDRSKAPVVRYKPENVQIRAADQVVGREDMEKYLTANYDDGMVELDEDLVMFHGEEDGSLEEIGLVSGKPKKKSWLKSIFLAQPDGDEAPLLGDDFGFSDDAELDLTEVDLDEVEQLDDEEDWEPDWSVFDRPVAVDQDVEQVFEELRGCDAGGTCNLPLAYLATQPVDSYSHLDSIIIFDYSDFDKKKADRAKNSLTKCRQFWFASYGWVTSTPVRQPFGYSFMLSTKAGDGDFSQDAGHHHVVHVVTFQGKTKGDQLVQKFKTMHHVIWPNYFGYSEGLHKTGHTARVIMREYAPFVREAIKPEHNLFGFRRPVTKAKFEAMYPATDRRLHENTDPVVMVEAKTGSERPQAVQKLRAPDVLLQHNQQTLAGAAIKNRRVAEIMRSSQSA